MFKRIFHWIRNHSWRVTLVVILIILGMIFLPKRIKAYLDGPEAIYNTTQPKIRDLVQVVDISGKINADQQATLKFQTSGRLSWVGVKKGDSIQKWQAVASLDKKDLKRRLEKEVIDYQNERWDFEQDHQDYDSRGLPLEKALLSDSAKRILEKAQFDLDKTVLDLEIAQEALNLATIYSPIAGLVIDVDIPLAGVNITPATATFTVANPEQMIFRADVDEGDISHVKIGQKVLIELDAYPGEIFEGLVNKIDFAAVTTRGGGTAFPIEVSLPNNEELHFKIGLNGDAEIVILEKKGVLSLPLEAINEENSHAWVEVIVDRSLQKKDIGIGLLTDTHVEITSGLKEDEKIVIGTKKAKK
ncbi:efflux RND transporter periplasmic adaptor subunit [Patescibacteria group bacterium]